MTESDADNAPVSSETAVMQVDGGSPGGRADSETTVDPEALRRRWELVLLYREEMLKIARRRLDSREDAEDVVASALMRTVEHSRLDEARIGAFLCTTVMRLAVDVHRDRARQLAVGTRDATRTLPSAPVEELLCDEDEARWLAEQLQNLPERERQVLQARLSGLTAQQTSAQLGLTAKATENAFTRVRQRAHGLLAATLAGFGILFGGMRRLTRPELVLVPAAAATALVLAVVVDSAPSAIPPASTPVVLDVATAPVTPAPSPTVPVAPASSAPVSPPPSPTAPPAASTSNPLSPSEPAPARTEITAPPVMDKDVVDPGGAATYQRHTDETFEESVQRCWDNMDLTDPLADPCR